MTEQLSDISDENKCKAVILDSLMKDNFITRAQPPPPPAENFAENVKNFCYNHKKALLTGTFVVGGLIAGPPILAGIVGVLGFGEAGIAAGSIAAWMMSLHRGTVAAGSLVAILQSVGAAGLGIGGVIASGLGGGFFAGAIAKALLKKLESEELAELDRFVLITGTNKPEKVTFNMKHPLLVSDEVLNSFLRGFDSARRITQAKQFKFLIILDDEKCIEGSTSLLRYLNDTYGTDHVSKVERGYFLNLNEQGLVDLNGEGQFLELNSKIDSVGENSMGFLPNGDLILVSLEDRKIYVYSKPLNSKSPTPWECSKYSI